MEFAVVRFITENAPGIVSANWINRRKGTCLYPNIRSEIRINSLLLKRTTPGTSWLECPIKVLKEFASYESAKTYMSEVEENTNSDSASESNTSNKRPKTPINISDEDSRSEEDEPAHKKPKTHPLLQLYQPLIAAAPNTTLSQNQYQLTFSLPVPTSSRVEPIESPANLDSNTEVSKNKAASSSQDYLNPNNDQGIVSDIEQLKTNQTSMCNTLAELLNTMKNLESKVDRLLANSQKQSSSAESCQDVEDMDLISLMPLGINGFNKLNERISKSHSFKQYLRLILKTAGGKDTKAFVANILRKMISDDVGEKYSLTGKHLTSGPSKLPFQKVPAYKLISEVCYTAFPGCKENSVREAISDWLMQSKFRKSRREKRTNSSQSNRSLIQLFKEEPLSSTDD